MCRHDRPGDPALLTWQKFVLILFLGFLLGNLANIFALHYCRTHMTIQENE